MRLPTRLLCCLGAFGGLCLATQPRLATTDVCIRVVYIPQRSEIASQLHAALRLFAVSGDFTPFTLTFDNDIDV